MIESEFKLRLSGSKSYTGPFEWTALHSIKLRHFGVSLSAFTYKLRKMNLARFFFLIAVPTLNLWVQAHSGGTSILEQHKHPVYMAL